MSTSRSPLELCSWLCLHIDMQMCQSRLLVPYSRSREPCSRIKLPLTSLIAKQVSSNASPEPRGLGLGGSCATRAATYAPYWPSAFPQFIRFGVRMFLFSISICTNRLKIIPHLPRAKCGFIKLNYFWKDNPPAERRRADTVYKPVSRKGVPEGTLE